MTDLEIQKYIEENCRYPDGSSAMDEQAFYEGAKWYRDYVVNKLTIPRVKHWLLTRKWLWKKIVFDNGIVGKNYHRYDHRILPYCQGMGDNGKYGDVNTAIKWTIEALNRACD